MIQIAEKSEFLPSRKELFLGNRTERVGATCFGLAEQMYPFLEMRPGLSWARLALTNSHNRNLKLSTAGFAPLTFPNFGSAADRLVFPEVHAADVCSVVSESIISVQ
jgi:hypothetical protein